MSGWVPQEKALVHDPAAELIETGSPWTPALGMVICRFFGDIRDLAAVG
jgi:hypothetical protein